MTTLIRLLRLLAAFRWQMAAAVILGVATVGSGVGLMATAAYLIASAALQPSIAELQVAIVGVRFFGLSRGVFRYLERLVSHDVTLRILGRLRWWFFRALEPLVPARTVEMRSSDLLTRAVTDVESLQDFFIRALAPPLVAALVAVGSGLVLEIYSSELALAFIGAYAATAVLIPLAVIRMGTASGASLISVRSELAMAIADGIEGMADLLVFGREDSQTRLVVELSRSVSDLRERVARIEASGTAGVTFATHATAWLVLVLAIPMVGEGRFTGVGLAVVCLVVMAAFEAVQPLPAAARGMAEQLAAADRIFAILDASPAVSDSEASSVEPRSGVGGAMEWRGVSFAYPGASGPALRGFDLVIGDGRRVAVVGPSGSGKSTVANLLLRFWDPTEGEILLADTPLGLYSHQTLREAIGVLPQRTDLFTGTIRDNLLLAAPSAGQDDLDHAAAVADLLDTVRTFPEGWDTWIGEHGMQLSGGQRRRLALARLVLQDPLIAVLDEPTSGLDPVTEDRVMRSVLELFRGRTTIVITHRLVALDEFDEIVVLDHGRIVERGNHAELMAAEGLYRQLHDSQQLELATR
jgi:ATP-binding cassette, subfamily C, bacterial CydC